MTRCSVMAELANQDLTILSTFPTAGYSDSFSQEERRLISCEPWTYRYSFKARSSAAVEAVWNADPDTLPKWFIPAVTKFLDLLDLKLNWDSYGASPVDLEIAIQAMSLMMDLLPHTSRDLPWIVPLSTGGIQLEWHSESSALEIVFEPKEEPYFYFYNRSTGEEQEQEVRENIELLRERIGRIG